MLLNNVNINQHLVRYIELYKPEIDLLILQQFNEDKEFNLSSRYKELIYLNTCFDYVDSLFKIEARYKPWTEILKDPNLLIIRRKMAYLGFDIDTVFALYGDMNDNVLYPVINESPIMETIELIKDVYVPIVTPSLIELEVCYGKASTTYELNLTDYQNSYKLQTTLSNPAFNIIVNNFYNQCPFVMVEQPYKIISILDDKDETIGDYIDVIYTAPDNKKYNGKLLDGITSISIFNRDIKIGL